MATFIQLVNWTTQLHRWTHPTKLKTKMNRNK